MQRYPLLSLVFILAVLSTGCAPKATGQVVEVKALEDVLPMKLEASPTTSAQTEVVPHGPPTSCPVTVPQNPPFTAPAPYSPDSALDSNFWYGSSSLRTDLPKDGIWYGLPHNLNGYTQKIFWWREGYIWNEEPEPELTVTGERLDADAPPLISSGATNAYAGDIGSAMLVGVDFPTPGCWKITGTYVDAELSFVIWVIP